MTGFVAGRPNPIESRRRSGFDRGRQYAATL